jgi:peptidoglycan hydrolase-like protein with peptidoglycan-binding domain
LEEINMLRRKSFRLTWTAIMALILTSSLSLPLFAQGRPRHPRNQRGGDITIPVNTVISMRMDNTLSSRISRVGDKFTATVAVPVHINGQVAIPAGSIVEGRITQVTPAKRKSKPGTLAVEFDELIFPDGLRFKVDGFLTADDPDMQDKIDDENRVSGSNKDRTGVFVGGGGAVGAVLGGILAGGVEGILLGGVIGAGAGIAGILLSKGEEARVPAGTPFGIQLRQPMIIRSQDVAQNPNRAGDPDPSSGAGPDPADYRSNPPNTRRSDQPELKGPESRPSREPESSSRPNRGIESPPNRQPERDEPVEPEPEPNEPEDSAPETAPAEPLPLSSPEMISRAQAALRDEGYYEGEIDGNVTPRMSAALKTYQKENGLPETGSLDPETARKLGILGTPAATRAQGRRSPVPASDTRTSRPVSDGTSLARVLSAKANRRPDGSIDVSIETQANTGGWRWFGESVINGDTLEVYARATRPSGPATQVITRGRIDLNVKEDVEHVRRVVVHGEGGDVNIPLTSGNTSSPRPASPGANPNRGTSAGTRVNTNINRQAEELLAEYQRVVGYRSDGGSVSIDNRQYGEPELELLFALDSFVNSARLYSRMVGSLQDQTRLRVATLSLAREARRADKVITTTSSRTVAQIEGRWDTIRQEVLRLMQIYGITTDELEGLS